MERIKVLIADDHTMFRQTLRKALQSKKFLNVVGEASDGQEVISKCQQLLPDVVLMDLQMPEKDGIEAIRTIRKRFPDVRILALTMHEDDDYLFKALQAGVNGYILKSSPLHKLFIYIEAIDSGESILDSNIAERVIDQFGRQTIEPKKENIYKLTSRETEILQLLANGLGPKEVAKELFISQKTVKNHICNIYSKLDCHDRTQAILDANRLGLINTKH